MTVVTLSSIRLWRLGKWIAGMDDDGRFERLDVVAVVVADMMNDTGYPFVSQLYELGSQIAIRIYVVYRSPSFFTFLVLKEKDKVISLS